MSAASAFRWPGLARCIAEQTHPSEPTQASTTYESRQP